MATHAAIAGGRRPRGFLLLVAAGLLASYLAGAGVVVAASGGPARVFDGLFFNTAAEATP